ncbi:uncharacterized protein AB675_5607 [Cyphellophora attinorum]|uniref:BHLH domain-containing protein n=1 Tax=Cyphellophora attinorum TaxID=1664694 RepID=A0A0N0NNZ2_9EURO|nr:uncharacterized protein AB675_5607 [Phialophora attinorum]KPI41949.1 hypothetical protein AB675_5607 [Phialophora attinorum]
MPFSRMITGQASYTGPSYNYDPNLHYIIDGWHEQNVDFTGYEHTRPTRLQHSTSDIVAIDSLPTVRRPPLGMDKSEEGEMFSADPYEFSELMNVESNTLSPLDISSASSVRSSSLSGVDPNICPAYRAAGTNATNFVSEKVCPLLSGDTDVCDPSQCGPDAPCMNFTSLPAIEECVPAPRIRPSDLAQGPHLRSPLRTFFRLRRPISVDRRRDPAPISVSGEDSKPAPSHRPAAKRDPSAPGKTVSRTDKKQRAKQAHSLVEKKYRENLNTKLQLLHTTIQNAQYRPNRLNNATNDDSDIDSADDEDYVGHDIRPRAKKAPSSDSGYPTPTKFKKSEVLDDAMNYINQSEVEMRHMQAELTRLKEHVRTLERTVKMTGHHEDCSLSRTWIGPGAQQGG